MSTVSFSAVLVPFLAMLVLGVTLRVLARLLMFSSRRRSQYLFSGTPWLPLGNHSVREDGEEIQFQTADGFCLIGSFFRRTAPRSRGVVLFCHEFNGSRYGVVPYIDAILAAGFDLLTFDFRGHGESQSCRYGHPTPRVTTDNLTDVRAAIDWLASRGDGADKIALFGMGKGATVALCAAAGDARIASVILDGASPEGRLFQKSCWCVMTRSLRAMMQTGSPRFGVLFARAFLSAVIAPFHFLRAAWSRFVLGFWCGCRFVNTWSLVRRVRQPILIVHGNVDSKVRPDQIHAFRERMPQRPEVCFVPKPMMKNQPTRAREDCCRRVVEFLNDSIAISR